MKLVSILLFFAASTNGFALNLPTNNGEEVLNVIADQPFYKHQIKSRLIDNKLLINNQIVRCQIERPRFSDSVNFVENNGLAFGQVMLFAKNLFSDPLVLSASEKATKLDTNCTQLDSEYVINSETWNKTIKMKAGIEGGWYAKEFSSYMDYNTCVQNPDERYGQALSMLKLRYFQGQKSLLSELPERVFNQDFSYGWASKILEKDLGGIEFTEQAIGDCFDVRIKAKGFALNEHNIDGTVTKSYRIDGKMINTPTFDKTFLSSPVIGSIPVVLTVDATLRAKITPNHCAQLVITDANDTIQLLLLDSRKRIQNFNVVLPFNIKVASTCETPGESVNWQSLAIDLKVDTNFNALNHSGTVRQIDEKSTVVESSLQYCGQIVKSFIPQIDANQQFLTTYLRSAWFSVFRGGQKYFYEVEDDILGTLQSVHRLQYFGPMTVVSGFLETYAQTLEFNQDQSCVISHIKAVITSDEARVNKNFTIVKPSHSDGPENMKSDEVVIQSCEELDIALAQVNNAVRSSKIGYEFEMYYFERQPYFRAVQMQHLFTKPLENGCREITNYTIGGVVPNDKSIFKLNPADVLLEVANGIR